MRFREGGVGEAEKLDVLREVVSVVLPWTEDVKINSSMKRVCPAHSPVTELSSSNTRAMTGGKRTQRTMSLYAQLLIHSLKSRCGVLRQVIKHALEQLSREISNPSSLEDSQDYGVCQVEAPPPGEVPESVLRRIRRRRALTLASATIQPISKTGTHDSL